ncbi:ankyrin [Parathielavia appendiculata]|uniref:Ankyrin n=1 Tax=Parathielavia appendiculata TaxID=2587402 RepID=A0AAN6TRE2_9PEZI|nr:ankyrin [Parathielavia appendiculata]
MGLSKLREKLHLRKSSAKKHVESSAAAGSGRVSGAPAESQRSIADTTTEPLLQPKPAGAGIHNLWNIAYEKLREENETLVHDYEENLRGDLGAGQVSMLSSSAPDKREQVVGILRRKMDEIDRETWKLRFGATEVQVKDLAQPVVGIISRVNEYISGAVASNPYAATAWTGVTLLLPLLLNPSEQAAALATGLEHISSLINQSRMWEELYIRRYESPKLLPTEASSRDSSFASLSHGEYKTALGSLYKEILRFQLTSYCYYSNNAAFRLGLDVIKWNDWSKLLDDVREKEGVFAAVSAIWRDMKYDEECAALDARHREAMLRWDAIGADVTGLRKAVEDAQKEKKRAKLLDWLCNIDPSETHNAARAKHEKGTGDWLVRHNEQFQAWREQPGSLLWLHGKAGCGKSILASTVIKHLRKRYSPDPLTALAYFYFSFSDAKKQGVDGMLASLVKQLCSRRPILPRVMDSLHEFRERGERPDAKTLEETLIAAMAGFSSVHIVIDALDECLVLQGERRLLLDTVRRIVMAAPANLHVFLTSRKEVDIEAVLGPLLSPPSNKLALDLSGATEIVNRDIGLYIDSVLASPDFEPWPDNIKTEARTMLIERADGMFQYVAQQFDALRNLSSVALIRTAIQELPAGLDATYERLLQNVDPRFQPQVASSLQWLAFSHEVLRLEELAEVFILRPDRETAFDEADRLFEPRHVLKYFSSLVVTEGSKSDDGSDWDDSLDSDSDSDSYVPLFSFGDESDDRQRDAGSGIYVRLAHYSIKEYLISQRITQGPAVVFAFSETEAHLHIAHSCLAYHLQHCAGNESQAAGTGRLWLRDYAVHHWPQHLELVPRELWLPEIAEAAARALAAGSRSLHRMMQVKEFRPWVDDPGDEPGEHSYSRENAMMRHPQWLTARMGFVQLTDMLLSLDKYPTQESLDTALVEAAYGGRTAAVEFLLDRGASLDATCEPLGLDALQAAAYRGHRQTVKTLLSRGANIDAQNGGFGSALQAACAGNRPRIVRLLLRRRVNVNLPPSHAGSLVTSAVRYASESESESESESVEILQLLLDKGAVINAAGGSNAANKETPLHAAGSRIHSRRRHFRLLVERGADVNAPGGEYGYPLQALSSSEHGGTRGEIQLLLDKGAEVNARGGKYGSALQGACHHNHMRIDGTSVVELLLNRGADAHAQGGHFGTVLQAACTSKPYARDLVRLLLERGVDVHAQGGYFGNALQASCYHGNWDVAELLLDLGVDVNASGGEYGSALQAAAASEAGDSDKKNKIMRLLLDRGAEVNHLGGRYGTALQAAAFNNDTTRVQLLLEHSADINLVGGEYGTALQAACAHSSPLWDTGDPKLALFLIEKGADVHAQGGHFGSAWHAAASYRGTKWETVLQLMLDRGIDVNDPRGVQHGTALQAAMEPLWSNEDRTKRIRFLLNRGANANIQGGKYGSPLQSACVCAYKQFSHLDITFAGVKSLLENCPDIDVNAQGGVYGTALQAAAYWGQKQAVRELLLSGAHSNLRGGKYGSALNAAVISGAWDVVELLLASGARPDCQVLPAPDEDWLATVCEEDGRAAVERYRVFWDKCLRLS